ncbi:Chromosome III, complete sequence, related [Eimeria tenella]|uniref:Chromosome III, complete sequence, related n=1 Tax=Eimeria tenella TaxID=5802 RepID=U6L864_EIMTE|nr:Chromosome III, complete sequence, related [Eimeria tenella]CDJ44764.1 Chromosome III, complete sequence, related [Eimeria tenella]|eukprot:XP_013235512.1 Chromosome III, complete sequence, related [Eimeria tenella]
MGRKVSLARRGSSSSKKGSSKKGFSAKSNSDEEGWIREKGKYLDLCYRVERESCVSMKVRGKLPCALFAVLAILNESDLAGNWAPMFKSAELVTSYSRASQLLLQTFDYPLLGLKETVLFSFGVNALEECGAVIIFCCSPPEPAAAAAAAAAAASFLGRPLPPKGKLPRAQSADLVFLLYPLSGGSQTTLELYGAFHHGLRFVPQRLVTFVLKKVVRGMFVQIARQCQNFNNSPYRERVNNNPTFYSWMKDCIDDYLQADHQLKQLESISLCSFNYEDFQDT